MKTIAEYEMASGLECEPEEYLCLENARLVFSDARKFSKDYSNVAADAEHSEELYDEAEDVLLSAGAIISEPHASSNPLHAQPAFAGTSRIGYRPPRYGRAAIFELSHVASDKRRVGHWEGLLDIKGCGVSLGKAPELGGTRTGVLFMHEALIELINHTLLDKLFKRDGMGLSTVPFYAIADIGIRANVAWAKRGMPCATLLRKAIVRPLDNNELPESGSEEEAIHHDIECYLLSRGLTTTGPITTVSFVREEESYVARLDGTVVPQVNEEIIFSHLRSLGLYPPQVFHFANLQIARDSLSNPLRACLIDLGHIRACNNLPGHIGIFVRDRPLNFGIITQRGSSNWPTICKQGSIDYSVFGPQLLFEREIDPKLVEWLQPTTNFQKVVSGVVYEAIRLTMLVDKEGCSMKYLMSEISKFVDRACPSY